MAQLKTTAWQYLRCPVAFFATHGKDFVIIFLTFKRKLWAVVPNHEIWAPRGMTSLRQAVGNDMKKYSLHLIFTFYFNRVTLVLEIFPFVVFHSKTAFQSICVDLAPENPLLNCWILVENPKWRSYQYILLQTKFYIMTINRHNNISVPTDQKCADSRRIDRGSIIAHTVNFPGDR